MPGSPQALQGVQIPAVEGHIHIVRVEFRKILEAPVQQLLVPWFVPEFERLVLMDEEQNTQRILPSNFVSESAQITIIS